MRVGIGYDIHALKAGRRLVLGGVQIPFSKGLEGHSDGDALLHAVLDAVLGALGEGDLGQHFPPGDRRYKNVSSGVFVAKVRALLQKRRFAVAHIDSTIVAEAPRLSAYKESIRRRIAQGFGLRVENVGVKAKTNEGFGAVGRKEAIACWAVASLVKRKDGKSR